MTLKAVDWRTAVAAVAAAADNSAVAGTASDCGRNNEG